MDFDRLYADYADVVYSYLKFRLKDAYLVEDIFQETFLSVYANMQKWHEIESVKAWILKIAHHKMVDRLRKSPPLANHSDHENLTEASSEQQVVEQLDLQHIINRLDDISRQIVYGIYVERLTYKELAQLLGIPEGTVKSKCYYARSRLRNWCKEEDESHGIYR